MNVLRAIQVFSPAVSPPLKFLQENNDARLQGVDATVKYIETMYNFFQIM
jgi:hypothetical protein